MAHLDPPLLLKAFPASGTGIVRVGIAHVLETGFLQITLRSKVQEMVVFAVGPGGR